MSSPLVSIVVPIYKSEKFLRQCINSIIEQSLENIEIILVDEGDMDECRVIIDEYEFGAKKDSRIKSIHEKNGGYGASVNKGIALASGKYIGIVEADDFIDKKMYLDLYNIAEKYDADIVKSDFYFYTTSDNRARKGGKINKFKANKIINVKKDASILRIQPSIWSAIYKTSFIKDNDIKFLETKGGCYQDTSFAFKTLSLADKIVLTPKAYLYYRTDNENSSVNTGGKVYAISGEYEEITKFIENNTKIKKFVNDNKLINQYNAYIWNLIRINEQDWDGFIDKFSAEFASYNENKELTPKFYKKVSKNAVNMLINDRENFKEYVKNLAIKEQLKQSRNKKFSIRINTSRISIVLFGKQIIEKEF